MNKSRPVSYWCKWWPKSRGWTGSDNCLEQSRGLGGIYYYIYMCGNVCMKIFMTLAAPAILGPDIWRHINKQAIWLLGFTKAYVNLKNSNSTRSQCVQRYFIDPSRCFPADTSAQTPLSFCTEAPWGCYYIYIYHAMISHKAKTSGSCKYARCQVFSPQIHLS